jgi:hypothetical protein
MSQTRNISSLVAAGLLIAAASTGALGQDASPSPTPSANQSSPAATEKSAADKTAADKPPAVCFKLTGRCVEPGQAKTTAATKDPATPTAKDGNGKKLNLSAPDVRTVVPAEELKEPLPSGDQVTEVQEENTVAVKSESEAPDVPGGFGAIWWALNHPSQAWRIVAPAE